MRKIIIFLILFLSMFSLSIAQSDTQLYVEKVFDRAQNKTTISPIESIFQQKADLSKQPRVRAIITYWGQAPSENEFIVALMITSQSAGWKFKNNYTTYCYADDEPIEVQKTLYQDKALGLGSVFEGIWAEISYSSFIKLCDAKKLEFKIASTSFEAGEFEMICIKQVRSLHEKK